MLETTLGGMVCALDEDQVGEFVPALHNISAQYHVDRAHSRRLVSVSIPPALNVSPGDWQKSTKAGRSEAASLFDSLFRADPRGFAIGLVHPFHTFHKSSMSVEVKPSHQDCGNVTEQSMPWCSLGHIGFWERQSTGNLAVELTFASEPKS